jgi:hypothetical protein
MTISVEIATIKALRYIAENLREQDRTELSATAVSDNLTSYLSEKIMAHAEMAFVTFNERGVPMTAWGLVPQWPGVGSAFAFGTNDWGRALGAMTRNVRRFMIPFVLDNGYHRIECRALAHREDVGRWIALFGAKQEAVLRSSGRRGEDFVLYRWLSDEHRRKHPAAASVRQVTAGESRGRGAARAPVRDLLPRERL